MNKFLLDIPERIETERLYLRAYEAGDGPMYFAAGMRKRLLEKWRPIGRHAIVSIGHIEKPPFVRASRTKAVTL